MHYLEDAYWHLFRIGSFTGGRPDMQAAATRKRTARRANEEDGSDGCSSSGKIRSNLCHGYVDGARAGHSRVRGICSRQKQTTKKRAQDHQLRDAHPASSRPTATGLGTPSSEMAGSDSDSMLPCPRGTETGGTETETSDDEDPYSLYYAVKAALAKESARSSSQLH